MKSIFLFFILTSINKTSSSQDLLTRQRDSISFSIKLIDSLKKYSTHGECYVEATLTNNSKTTIFYIDDNNMSLANYVTENDSLWIWRGDFVGGPIPTKKSLLPDNSVVEKISVFGFKDYGSKFKIGFDIILTSQNENISNKSKYLYKKENIIWSNILERIK